MEQESVEGVSFMLIRYSNQRIEYFKHHGQPLLIGLSELKRPYELAASMLGSTTNPHLCDNEEEIRKLGQQLGCEDTFKPTTVGVYFGDGSNIGKKVSDPYFSGQGPERGECNLCGPV